MGRDTNREREGDESPEALLRRMLSEFGMTLREEWRTELDRFDRRLTSSRKADVIAGLQEWSELRPDEMPELRSFIQYELQSRRDRKERIRELATAVRGGVWEVLKHAITAAIIFGVGYLGYANWIR